MAEKKDKVGTLKSLGSCGSSRKYRIDEEITVSVKIENKGSTRCAFGVEVGTAGDTDCDATSQVDPGDTTEESLSINPRVKRTSDLVCNIYEQTDCTNNILDSETCDDMVDIWHKRTLFKGQKMGDNPNLNNHFECSPGRDNVQFRAIGYYYIWVKEDGEWKWKFIKEIYDSGWICCKDSDQKVEGNINYEVPLSHDEVGQWSSISVGIYFWKEGDGSGDIEPTCWDDDLYYLYGGER